ncbi:DUF2207 domain-containing protein [Flavobacterium oreochromis]|uniref:DUF2207 domain-containing protein n=1 Tax=Flavobacterium oreochromis TaxID=2906078 RepID=A0ABW8P803_9FLAO
MSFIKIKSAISIVFLFIFFTLPTKAQERIINYDVEIQIEHSGLIQVTEKIKVQCLGEKIQHGIKRILPLYREDKYGTDIKIDYNLKTVFKDNHNENYFTEKDRNNWYIYIGNKNVTLDSGVYEYQIVYTTPYQIGFFEQYDELYWNVTGNEWDFPIQNTSCKIILPNTNDRFNNAHCYTGIKGSKESQCDYFIDKNTITFKSQFLNLGEGFTVAAAFPKNIVVAPEKELEVICFFNSIKHYFWTLLFALGTLLFYFLNWKKNGKDLRRKTPIPEFRPPYNWSPAILSYVFKGKITQQAFMASIINLAIKKKIKINSKIESGIFVNSEKYEIEVLNRESYDLSIEETIILEKTKGKEKIVVDKQNTSTFQKMNNNWDLKVREQINLTDYYISNRKLSFNGFLLFILSSLTYVWLVAKGETNNIFYLGLIILGSFCYYFISLKNLSTPSKILVYGFGFFIYFFSFGVLIMTIPFLKSYQIAIIGLVFICYVIYAFSIGKYTNLGNEAQERIKGFKMYLETAEKNSLQALNPPKLTPQLFEELLPYAIALGIEDIWGKNFVTVLEQAQYEPNWYKGDKPFAISNFSPTFNSSLNNLSQTQSSSSSSGSSWSSGSSGSGSSGGGGGGGGGGGW